LYSALLTNIYRVLTSITNPVCWRSLLAPAEETRDLPQSTKGLSATFAASVFSLLVAASGWIAENWPLTANSLSLAHHGAGGGYLHCPRAISVRRKSTQSSDNRAELCFCAFFKGYKGVKKQ
jgi:hypothetical protein